LEKPQIGTTLVVIPFSVRRFCMAKGKDKGKTEEKKKPVHSLKEKRLAKKEKKASKTE
jgi:hypothetical protein